jgi:hypothetical protein
LIERERRRKELRDEFLVSHPDTLAESRRWVKRFDESQQRGDGAEAVDALLRALAADPLNLHLQQRYSRLSPFQRDR